MTRAQVYTLVGTVGGALAALYTFGPDIERRIEDTRQDADGYYLSADDANSDKARAARIALLKSGMVHVLAGAVAGGVLASFAA